MSSIIDSPAILIVDDHPLFREGLRAVVKKIPKIRKIDEASDGNTALSKMKEEKFDIILLDIDMPGMNGLDAMDRIRNIYPGSRVIVVTLHAQPGMVLAMFDKGVCGYLLKNSSSAEIRRAIMMVADGSQYFPAEIQTVLWSNLMEREKKSKEEDAKDLTERETEILTLFCEQLTCAEIADKLSLSESTVNSHRYRIMEKIGAKNLAGMVVYAVQQKIFMI